MDISVYQRPNKPDTLTVRRRSRDFQVAQIAMPEIVTVDRSTECHVTPKSVAKRMVSYLEAEVMAGELLEPEGGTGVIVNAMLEAGFTADSITTIERSTTLCSEIRTRFSGEMAPINQCFLDFAKSCERAFDYVVMNPPFRAYIAHINAAQSLLKKAGVIVALVPSTFDHEGRGFELIEHLPSTTFETTKVHTKIVRYMT